MMMTMMSMSMSASAAVPFFLCPSSRSSSKVGAFSASSSSFCYSPNSALVLNKKNKTTLGVTVSSTPSRNKGLTCNALFGLGVPELVVIAGVAALVFGPKKLPEVGRSIGKTFKSFQQAAKEFESELKKEPDSSGGDPSEKVIAVSEQEEEKQGTEVSSSKESV